MDDELIYHDLRPHEGEGAAMWVERRDDGTIGALKIANKDPEGWIEFRVEPGHDLELDIYARRDPGDDWVRYSGEQS